METGTKKCAVCGKPAVVILTLGCQEFDYCAAHSPTASDTDDVLMGLLRLQERQTEALEAIARELTRALQPTIHIPTEEASDEEIN